MNSSREFVRHLWLLVLAGLLCLPVGAAQAQSENDALSVGDPLPFLQVKEWLQGDPIQGWQQDHFYLIDLWATWCTPCLASMPLLESLQVHFAKDGLIVIGITSEDQWGNDLASVQKFLASRQGRISYRMAWLPPSRSQEKKLQGIFVHEWMQRLGTMSLPKAFLVDGSGHLLWVGNPHSVEARVQALVAGEFDMARARQEFEGAQAAKALRERVDEAVAAQNWKDAETAARELFAQYSDVADPKLFTGLAVKVSAAEGDVPTSLREVAVQAAEQAVRDTRFEAPGQLDGLASALAARGDLVGAALAEMRAIQVAEGNMKAEQQKKLDGYLQKLGLDSASSEHAAP
jgi:thiol-disulfide isomerase/thioredoxin